MTTPVSGSVLDRPAGSRMAVLALLLVAVAVMTSPAGASPTSHGFDRAFNDFLHEHGYSGGAVAAMKDGSLLFAEGFGLDRSGKQVTAHSKFHVSSLAKSLTGVAIMRLVQEERLALDDKVFGEGGLLYHIKPWRRETVDARLKLITVEHLLHHSCGWDVDHAPLYDPLLNKLYLSRGHDVPDIARQLGEAHPLEPETLISYVMSQPLAFAPDTRVAYSNMAYLVLGRIVEAASQLEYRDFVKKYILEPCGMWNTRLELAPGHDDYLSVFGRGGSDGDANSGGKDTGDRPLYTLLDSVYADSALGWFSNVYDLMRFTRCAFETNQLLNDRHLELLLERQGSSPSSPGVEQRGDTWYAAGFRTNSHGVVWQDGDAHADDLILYHDTRPTASQARKPAPKRSGRAILTGVLNPNTRGSSTYWQADPARREELAAEVAEERERLPDSWVVLLHGRSIHHIRHHSRDLMGRLDMSKGSLPGENLFLYDLSDLHRHPSWEPDRSWGWLGDGAPKEDIDGGVLRGRRAPPEMTVRYHVDEHHLTAYVDALQNEGFDLHWFTSCMVERHTWFLVVGRRVDRPVRAQYDFVFQHGLDHRRLLKNKLWLERGGYNLTQLHSYNSRSHDAPAGRGSGGRGKRSAGGPSFAAVFRYEAYPPGTQMKYGTGHLPEPYGKLVQMYHEKDFFPVSQTVTWTRGQKDEQFAFVFIKPVDAQDGRTEFQQLSGLTVNELSAVTARHTKAQLRLSYLNSYSVAGGKFRFSAVFTNSTRALGLLETGQPQNKVSEITISNLGMGLAPKFISPYKEAGKLRYAVYYEEF